MKLSSQASQYWTNLENRRAARGRPPIDTWDRMKEELETKYVPSSFSAYLMDNWHQHTHRTNLQRSMSRNLMNSSSDVVPSIGKVKLKFFLDSESALEITFEAELLARKVNELEAAYVLV